MFWNGHDPTHPPSSRQYRSIILCHDGEQMRLAVESRKRLESELGTTAFTEIIPIGDFYLAEAYHQKYYLLQAPSLARQFKGIYPKYQEFVASTAVARVNGHLGGYGNLERLKADIHEYGLSPAGERMLTDITRTPPR